MVEHPQRLDAADITAREMFGATHYFPQITPTPLQDYYGATNPQYVITARTMQWVFREPCVRWRRCRAMDGR